MQLDVIYENKTIGTIDADDVQHAAECTLVIQGDAADKLQRFIGKAAGSIMGPSFDLAAKARVFEGCSIGQSFRRDGYTTLRIRYLREAPRQR